MCKQGVVQSLSLKQVPNHLVQVKNQLKQAVQEVVDPFNNSIDQILLKKRISQIFSFFMLIIKETYKYSLTPIKNTISQIFSFFMLIIKETYK